MKKIPLTIITVNLNNWAGLRKTIKSVAAQTDKMFEYVVVDGGSTDGCLELIKENSSIIHWWVSEPDTGIYNAMNKGIKAAKGQYVLFLNSGDWLVDADVVSKINNEQLNQYDILYADMVSATDIEKKATNFPKALDCNFFIGGCINHQNTLIKKELFQRFGYYDERFKIVGDWHFFLKIFCTSKIVTKKIDFPISFYEGGGISAQSENDQKRLSEIACAIKDVFPDLSLSIQELYDYKHSVYGNTLDLFGNTKVLNFILKAYRFIARRCPLLRSEIKHPIL